MHNVNVLYEDGKSFSSDDVVSISYPDSGKTVSVSEEDFSCHHFPVPRTFWLHTRNGMCVVNGTGMRIFEVIQK